LGARHFAAHGDSLSQPTSKTILLVGFDSLELARTRAILAAEGFEVGQASTAEDGLELALRQPPSLMILSAELRGTDPNEFCRRLRQNAVTQPLQILMIGAGNRPEAKIRSIESGADDYLPKPYQGDELIYRVKGLLARGPHKARAASLSGGRVIAVFSAKGGTGKTTIAVNLAICLRRRQNKSVALFDSDFFFGDLNVHLNIPSVRTFLDLVMAGGHFSSESMGKVVSTHSSGLCVLLSPQRPEDAELVTAHHVHMALGVLASEYEYVVVDCHTSYDDRTLAVLESASYILLVMAPELGAIENTALFFELAEKLEVPAERIHLLLNRFNSDVGIEQSQMERSLRHLIEFRVPTGGHSVALSVNRGVPLVLEKADHPFSEHIIKIAEQIGSDLRPPAPAAPVGPAPRRLGRG
jgi:pilus assembly protein CpaE